MPLIYFTATDDWAEFRPHLAPALVEAGITDARITTTVPEDPATVDYVICAPDSAVADFSIFTRAKAVLSLWAGVEHIIDRPGLTQPLVRMVDPAMTESMVEWVTGHVLRHHLGLDAHVVNPDHRWAPERRPLARKRPITILGLGELGLATARRLQAMNFPVTGWSRTAHALGDLRTTHGKEGLAAALRRAQIVVTLLPRTPGTENILNAETLGQLPRGAVVINPGRGELINDEDLIAALDSGQIGHATLDVFRVEPLPADHPFWRHPRVTVTPHVAAQTEASTAVTALAESIRRGEAGEPFLHVVDRARGY